MYKDKEREKDKKKIEEICYKYNFKALNDAYLIKSGVSSVGWGSVDGFMDLDGLSVDFYISGVLVVGAWFVGPYLGTESMGISNVVNLPGDTVSINVSVASLDIAVSISGFLSGLLEFTMVTSDVVVVLVWDGLGLKKKILHFLNDLNFALLIQNRRIFKK